MKDLNKLSFVELKKEVIELEKKKEKASVKNIGVWQLGKNYVIRTVTMIQVGKLVNVTNDELVMEDAAWVADTGRWMNFLKDGNPKEVEPFIDPIIVGRQSIIDATLWKHPLLTKQK